MEYPVVIRPLSEEDGGGYLAVFPDLPGCMSDGETPEEALKNAQDAFLEWMDTAKGRAGFVIPEPGSRAANAANERQAIREAVATLALKTSELDDELCDLRAKIEEIEEHLQNHAAWERFDVIVGRASAPSLMRRAISHQ